MCCDPLRPALCDLRAELPLSPGALRKVLRPPNARLPRVRSIPVPLMARVAVWGAGARAPPQQLAPQTTQAPQQQPAPPTQWSPGGY